MSEDIGEERGRRRRRSGGGLMSGSVIVLAAAVILVGVAVLGALAAPGSGAAGTSARLLPIPDVAAYRALKAMQSTQGARPDYAAAARAYHDELASAPVRSDAWAGLAYAEARKAGGRYSPAAVAALGHSYDLAPFDGSIFTWRTTFTLDGWDALTPEIRRAVVDEMSAVWTARPDLQRNMLAMAQAMPSPSGRATVQQALAAIGPPR